MKLGEKLKQLRDRQKWTQPEAAEAIGIEQSYLSKLENDVSVPSTEVFRKVLAAYEVEVSEIVDDVESDLVAGLTQIPDIADYVEVKRRVRYEEGRRRLNYLMLAVAFGAGFIYAGIADLFFPANEFTWANQLVTFTGIVLLVYGLIGLLAASTTAQKRRG